MVPSLLPRLLPASSDWLLQCAAVADFFSCHLTLLLLWNHCFPETSSFVFYSLHSLAKLSISLVDKTSDFGFSSSRSVHSLCMWCVCISVCVPAHTWPGVYVEIRWGFQVLAFTVYFVWDGVSLLFTGTLFTRLAGTRVLGDLPVSTSYLPLALGLHTCTTSLNFGSERRS